MPPALVGLAALVSATAAAVSSSTTLPASCWTAKTPAACAALSERRATGSSDSTEGCAWCPTAPHGGRCFKAATACPERASDAWRLPDEEYSTEEMVATLRRGAWLGEDSGVPNGFECSWRAAAMAHAIALLPSLTHNQQRDVHDALQLTTMCNQSFEPSAATATQPATPTSGDGAAPCMPSARCIAVSTADGLVTALATVAASRRATSASSSASAPQQEAVRWEVRMAPGTYRLNSTMVLGPDHSHTTISAPSGGVTITGSSRLAVSWKPVVTPRGVHAFEADVPAGIRVDALRVGGKRATRARFPNANPETDQFPVGWVTAKTASIPPTWAGNSTIVDRVLPGAYPGSGPNDRYGPHGFAGMYRMGYGGQCGKLTPPRSYWCQPDGRVANKVFWVRTPAGIANATSLLPHSPYAGGAPDAVVFYWRPGHWFTVMYGLAGPIDASSGDLHFGHGGFQGAEGHDTVAEWYIENVAEELDAPNEFFHDKENNRLLLVYNGTGAPPAEVEVPALTELVLINGTQANPVVGVTISGITFTGQRPTYLEPHGLPSGGDWGLERLGSVRLFGTQGTLITGCLFTTLDGNAVFLDGFNRNATVTRSEFVNLGASAVALWGYEQDGYGTNGEQPRFTTVTENVCHEIGLYQKQSSCFFQAVSAQSTVTKNLFYNGPRAMVNFNDNFGGGHALTDNLIFNSCRESSDHGAFNSWGRIAYATKVGDGRTVSAQPAYSLLARNFIVANYAADGGCYDNDDGSSWYLEQDNFCIFGGVKSNFEGHNKRATGNLHAFASVYGDHCLNGLNQISDYYADGYANNTCILGKANDLYLQIGGDPAPCDPTNKSSIRLQLGNNVVYAPGASVTVSCGKSMSGQEWLGHGVDVGTVLKDSATLSSADVVKIGLDALRGGQGQ